MEGIEKITAKIIQDSEAEITALLAQTEEKVKAVGEAAQAQADKESADALARGKRAAAERLERLQSAAQMETRKLKLAAKQEVVSEAFDLALEKLCTLPEQDYITLLTELVLEASSTGREQLIFSARDRARVGKQVVVAANEAREGSQLTLSQETREMRGGFVLVDGDLEVNCAFETLIRLQREKLERDVARVLFE